MYVALRRWRGRLLGYFLYSLNFTFGSDEYDLYTAFIIDPFYRNQVTDFTITLNRYDWFNPRLLLLLHPHLRFVRLIANYGIPRIRHFHENLENAVATPEVVYDFHRCEITRQMMHSNLGIRLHTLVLNFRHLNTNETGITMGLLQDLPLLRRLVLANPTFRLIHLEALHDNLPGLTTIELINVHVTKRPEVPNVQPALNVTRAICNYSGPRTPFNSEVFDAFSTYCMAKYPVGLILNGIVILN